MTALHFTVSIPPSVNHAYIHAGHGRRRLSADAEAWLAEAGYTAKQQAARYGWVIPAAGVKLVMRLWVCWPDNRRRDIHNLHKLMADAFEGILYVDDRYLLIRDMDYTVDKFLPHVVVKIGEV